MNDVASVGTVKMRATREDDIRQPVAGSELWRF